MARIFEWGTKGGTGEFIKILDLDKVRSVQVQKRQEAPARIKIEFDNGHIIDENELEEGWADNLLSAFRIHLGERRA